MKEYLQPPQRIPQQRYHSDESPPYFPPLQSQLSHLSRYCSSLTLPWDKQKCDLGITFLEFGVNSVLQINFLGGSKYLLPGIKR